jgi:glycosyltransferase involved in cell wall biosynthesis
MRHAPQLKTTFAIPGDLATPTGGYGYARHVIEVLRARKWHVDVLDLGGGFPHIDAGGRARARARLAGAPTDAPLVIDGLALGVLPDEAAAIASSHCLIGLVHHPLALETGLADAAAATLRASETRALAVSRHVITTDQSTAEILAADYAVPREWITVAVPGVPRAQLAHGSRDGFVRILSVGALVPRKGYDLLVRALAGLHDLPWRLTIVGDRDRHPPTTAALDELIAQAALGDRIACAGAVAPEQLDALYRAADIFVQPSWFEGYGMALAEALAYGLPVVATATGAAVRNVGADAGRLVTPGDRRALSDALHALIADAALRSKCAAAARARSGGLPRWEDTAATFEQVFARVSGPR